MFAGNKNLDSLFFVGLWFKSMVKLAWCVSLTSVLFPNVCQDTPLAHGFRAYHFGYMAQRYELPQGWFPAAQPPDAPEIVEPHALGSGSPNPCSGDGGFIMIHPPSHGWMKPTWWFIPRIVFVGEFTPVKKVDIAPTKIP